MEKKFGFPTLHPEADYAENKTEQLRMCIEAYLKMLWFVNFRRRNISVFPVPVAHCVARR